MKVKDGFKFGIGFFLAGTLVKLPYELIDKKSKLHREIKRLAAMWEDPETSSSTVETHAEPVKNKIGFTIE